MSNRIVTNTFSYKLTLGNTIDNEAKDSLELEQRDKKSITIGEKSYKIALNGVKFNRKIYQPGEIEAEILINEDLTGKDKIFATEVPTSSETKSLFMMRQVTLQVIQKDDDGNQVNTENPDDNKIAINYYVHELNPQLLKQASGGLTLAVKLTAYSMDKVMTLDKYSKVYVAKKLGSGILEPESKAFGCMIKNTQSSNQTSWSKHNYVETNRDHLRHLKYEQQVNVKVKGVTVPVTISSEFIHPYLIQYNETFYDFMARTANRCGEFLYFEKGQLRLGLEETTTPLDISGFATITGQQFSASPLTIGEYARDSMKEGINEPQETNYTRIKKNAAGFPEDAFPLEPAYNAELTADEYYFPLYADKFDSNNREWGYAHNVQEGLASYAFMTLKNLASSNTDPVGFITDAAFEKIKLAITTDLTVKDNNDTGKKNYIEKYQFTESGNGLQAVPFGSVSPEGWTTLRYLADVRRYEEAQQRETICIDMGTSYIPLRLGETIKVSGLEQTFIVIQIREISNEEWDRDYEKYGSDRSDRYDDKQSLKIFAIPMAETKNTDGETVQKPFPPVLPGSPIRKADPQTAFVTDNNDQKYQGRVRIVYPWQAVNLPERRALAYAEEEYAAKQKDYEKKNADYEAKQAAITAYKKGELKTNIEDSLKTVNGKINLLTQQNDNYTALIEEIQEELSSVIALDSLQADAGITLDQTVAKKLKTQVETLETKIKTLLGTTDEYETVIKKGEAYDTKIKELEDKIADKDTTDEKKKEYRTTLLKLKNYKTVHDILQVAYQSLDKHDETYARRIIAECADSLKADIERNQQLNSENNEQNDILPQKEYHDSIMALDFKADQDKTVGQTVAAKLKTQVETLETEIKTLLGTTDEYETVIKKDGAYDSKIKELEGKVDNKTITDDERKNLLKLKNYKTVHDILQVAYQRLDKGDEAYVRRIIAGCADSLKAEIERYQQLISENKEQNDILTKTKDSLTTAKTDAEKDNKELNYTLYNVTEDDVTAAKSARDDAEKVMNQAKTRLDKAADDYKKKLNEIASPWIRVATPMATDGGGAYFKPRQGDEVLVNYDSGNIERPYVVGSLFSKNVLVPDERNGRTIGTSLHGGASIAIVSPNGHGITFKDPGNANGFVSSVSPAISTIQNVGRFKIPMDGTDKDMAGGIRIGDRYGLYSIDMSSDKRSVKISSSLGTVKLDAYTGITISAPNGDIKIEGKNVTINAGNNLTLNSGMNIGGSVLDDFKQKKLKEKALSNLSKTVQSKLLDEFTVWPVDLNLTRTVLQTFLKPVGGTLTIKSKRYLKLEAGAGEARVSRDRYVADSPIFKFVDSATLYMDLNQIIIEVCGSLNGFRTKYETLWSTAFTNKDDLKKAVEKSYDSQGTDTVDNKVNNCLKDAWAINNPNWNDRYDDDNAFISRNLTGLQLKLNKVAPNDGKLKKAANDFEKAVYELHKHVDEFDSLVQDLQSIQSNQFKDKAKAVFDTMKDPMKDQVNSFKKKYLDHDEPRRLLVGSGPDADDFFISDMKNFKRKFAISFLQQVANDKTINPNIKFGKSTKNFKDLDDQVLNDQSKWTELVMNLDKLSTNPYRQALAGDGISALVNKGPKDFIKDNLKGKLKDLLGDRDIWDSKKDGQILFSDDEASTVHIEGTSLIQEKEANQHNINRLKKILLGL